MHAVRHAHITRRFDVPTCIMGLVYSPQKIHNYILILRPSWVYMYIPLTMTSSHLSPGGLAEFVEPQCRPGFHSDDGTIPKGGYVEKYVEIFERALRDANILEISILLESYLKETGFVDVQSTIRKLPLGPWPKDRYKKVTTLSPSDILGKKALLLLMLHRLGWLLM